MGRNEEGFGFVVSGLGLAAGLSVLMFDWPVSEHDTIIPIVIFPIPPSLPAPHIYRSQLSFCVDTQPQLVYSHNLTITNQKMIKDSRA